jgi:hypothetical protein
MSNKNNISSKERTKLKVRLDGRLRWEGLTGSKRIPSEEQYKIVDEIIKRIGLPNKCFFDSPYCFTPENRNPDLPMEFGHIKSQSKGGSITDPNNVIWICRRHNMMMGDRDLIDLKKFLESIRKQF